jgi:negative regulator of sigma E activity
VVVIAVRPRSDPRPTLLLWIDKETGLVLRSERRHADGSLAQAAVFTEIRYVDPPVAGFSFAPPRGVTVRQLSSSEPLRVEEIPAKMGFRPIVPAELSGGFVLNQVVASGSHTSGVAVLQYTDGLVTVSLFEHKAIEGARRTLRPAANVPVADRRLAARQVGDVAIVHWQVRGVDMTLTGELSADRLERIASGLGVEDTPGRVARLKFWLGSFWRHVRGVVYRPGINARTINRLIS